MRILFIKENREIEKKNVSVVNNEFKVNGKIYLVSNPNYYYSKLGKDKFSKKMILVYRENQPLPIQIGSENTIKNQLNYEITNDLIKSYEDIYFRYALSTDRQSRTEMLSAIKSLKNNELSK